MEASDSTSRVDSSAYISVGLQLGIAVDYILLSFKL